MQMCGPTLTASVQHAHQLPLHNTLLRLSDYTSSFRRGWSVTPFTPSELGSGSWLFKIRGQSYHVRERTEVNRGPGLSVDSIPPGAALTCGPGVGGDGRN